MAYATLAGGCFWCMVKPFTSYPGIKSVVSGYSGGHVENPTYEQVCTNQTGHVEAVQIEYDPNITMTEGSSLIEVKAINLSFFIMMRINSKLPS